jgi:uncharacterized protein (DUF1810 family)
MGAELERFVRAQDGVFDQALGEIEAGRKRTHWMWFVLPQLDGLGSSATARAYAIHDVDEAVAFLGHPVLGPRYRRIVDAVWRQVLAGASVAAVFGFPDERKLVSSVTLFGAAAARHGDDELAERCAAITEAAEAQGIPRCAFTETALGLA